MGGICQKRQCKKILVNNFIEEQDYLTLRNKAERQWVHDIYLSIDCAKSFAMLAQTDKGKQVRNYFLDCEKKLHQLQQNPQHQLLPAEIQQILF